MYRGRGARANESFLLDGGQLDEMTANPSGIAVNFAQFHLRGMEEEV
jgi:hypothetical protein